MSESCERFKFRRWDLVMLQHYICVGEERVGASGVEGFFGFFWVVVLDLGWGLDSVRSECDR